VLPLYLEYRYQMTCSLHEPCVEGEEVNIIGYFLKFDGRGKVNCIVPSEGVLFCDLTRRIGNSFCHDQSLVLGPIAVQGRYDLLMLFGSDGALSQSAGEG